MAATDDDIDYLKRLNRKLLARLERALQEKATGDAERDQAAQKTQESLLGKSLAATFVALADFHLRLCDIGPKEAQAAERAVPALTEADVALVESFVRRMREG